MAHNPLGIYFGTKTINIVESRGRKLVSNIQIPQSLIPSAQSEEKVPPEVKALEVVALIKDELRKNKIEAKEASIVLCGSDLIVRTFEIPMLPHSELEGAINFEARKHIPFKVEDLICAYQVRFEKTSHTNIILFMGIKKETMDRYFSILAQLNIKISAIEYSAFCALRFLKLAGVSDRDIIGVLETDLEGENEINLTVLENGFPLFSRDIGFEAMPQGEGAAGSFDDVFERLKKEVRVSLDYYGNKFPAKNIKKLCLMSNPAHRAGLEALIKEFGLSLHFIDTSRPIGKSLPFSMNFIKAYTGSLSKGVSLGLKLDLLTAREKSKAKKGIQKEAISLAFLLETIKAIKLDYRALALGLSICILTFGAGFYKTGILRKELNSVHAKQVKISSVKASADNKELTAIDSQYKNKLAILSKLISQQAYVTEVLNIIPPALPKGFWLTRLSYKKEEDRMSLVLEGMGYLADATKEFEEANKFISHLRQNPVFSKYFSEINIDSLDRRPSDKIMATIFSISCKNYQERK